MVFISASLPESSADGSLNWWWLAVLCPKDVAKSSHTIAPPQGIPPSLKSHSAIAKNQVVESHGIDGALAGHVGESRRTYGTTGGPTCFIEGDCHSLGKWIEEIPLAIDQVVSGQDLGVEIPVDLGNPKWPSS